MPSGIYKRTKPAWNKGIPCTEELKQKVSIANKGNRYNPFTKGHKIWVGKKHNQESKERMKLSHIGKTHFISEETKRKIGIANSISLKGKKQSKETRQKRSIVWIGDKNPNWKGGITSKNKGIRESIEYRLWREAVFARDNFTCHECKTRGGYLEAHHIKSFKDYIELRFAIDNGKTLCYDCHKTTFRRKK